MERLSPEEKLIELDRATVYLERTKNARVFFLVGFVGWIIGIILWTITGRTAVAWAGIVVETGYIIYSRVYMKKVDRIIQNVKNQ